MSTVQTAIGELERELAGVRAELQACRLSHLQDLVATESARDTAIGQVEVLREAVQYIIDYGAVHDDAACPCDDTCECETARIINAAMSATEPKP